MPRQRDLIHDLGWIDELLTEHGFEKLFFFCFFCKITARLFEAQAVIIV